MKNLVLLLFLFPSLLFAQKTQTEYYHNKLKAAEGKVDEKKHRTGEWKFWDHKGNLVAIRQYKDDQLDGICRYEKYNWEPTEPQLNLMASSKSLYEKAIKRQKVSMLDTIIEKTEYHKNQLHGIKYIYDGNGNPVSETSYYEDKKNGVQKNYNYKTGKLTDIQYFNNNNLDSLIGFDPDGNIVKRVVNSKNYIRKVEYDSGMMVRKEEHWYKKDGNMVVTCTYENNTRIKCDSTWTVNDNKRIAPNEPKTHTIRIPVMEEEDLPPQQEEEVLEFPEKEAKYPDGPEAMMKFIRENYKLPETNIEPTNSKIYVRFIVEKDGSLSNLEILRGAGEPYDKEARRVIRAMPKWEPAENNGKIVRSKYIIPIRLELR